MGATRLPAPAPAAADPSATPAPLPPVYAGNPIMEALNSRGYPPTSSFGFNPYPGQSADTSAAGAYANLPDAMQAGGRYGIVPASAMPAPLPPIVAAATQPTPAAPAGVGSVQGPTAAAPAPPANSDANPSAQSATAPAPAPPWPKSATARHLERMLGVPDEAPPARPTIGPLEAVGDFLFGGLPTAVRRNNYLSSLDAYQQRQVQGMFPADGSAGRSGPGGASLTPPGMSFHDVAAFKAPGESWGKAASDAMGAYYGRIGQGLQMSNLAAVGRALNGADQAGAPTPSLGPVGGISPRSPGYPGSALLGPLALPGLRSALAMSAFASGNPKDAADILSDKVVKGSDGYYYDEKTGARVGDRIPDHQIVNGYNVDPGAPDAPGFIPKLADGTMPDGRGGVVPIPGVVRAGAALTAADADARNASEARFAGPKAYGEGRGKSLTDIVSVPDGHGGFVQMTGAQYLARLNGRGGGSAGTLGRTPSPQDQAFANDQAKAASDTLNGDMDARPAALENLDSAHQALAYVQSHKSDRTSPYKAAGAQYLRSLPPQVLQAVGVDPKQVDMAANDPAVYQRLTSQNLLSFGKSNLPSRYTEKELMVANRVIPQLSTPNDAAAMHWGLQAAIANKKLQRAQFAAGYGGARTRQAVEQAWMGTPGGQSSLFADPVWKNVTLGGKPAVVYVRRGGKTYGIVGSGTGAPTSFLAGGR